MAPSLPTVDFSAFMSDEGVVVGDEPTAAQLSCAAHINDTCTDNGFLYLTNFGISDEDVADAFAKSAALFALSGDEKTKLNPYDPVTNLGFSAFASEALNARGTRTAPGAASAGWPKKWEWAWRGAARGASACVQYRAATWFRPPRAPAKTTGACYNLCGNQISG